MSHLQSSRILPAVALLAGLLSTACQTSGPVRPASIGDWRVAGASNALIASRDGGDFGDTDTIRGGISGGRFFTDEMMWEGVVTLEDTKAENSAGADTDAQVFTLGGGVRYYFDTVSASRPYAVAQAGLARLDVDDDVTGVDDSDTAPFLRVGGGLESFLNEHIAVDFGVMYERIFDLDLESANDDISTLAAMVGISVWL